MALTGKGFTRRRAIGAGAGAVAVLAAAQYGRLALGDEFEEHVASVLEMPEDRARTLLRAMRERLSVEDHAILATGFAAATMFPTDRVLSESRRRREIEEFLFELFDTPAAVLAHLDPGFDIASSACGGPGQR